MRMDTSTVIPAAPMPLIIRPAITCQKEVAIPLRLSDDRKCSYGAGAYQTTQPSPNHKYEVNKTAFRPLGVPVSHVSGTEVGHLILHITQLACYRLRSTCSK